MEFLSLHDPPEAPPGRRLTRAEAIGLSVLAHALLLLLLAAGPRIAPAGLVRWLEARPRPLPGIAAEAAATTEPSDPSGAERPAPETTRIPLKFAYVKVPNDVPTPPNREAALLSDRDRRARQEVPTPEEARLFTRDPHSEGDSIDRVRPDPALRAGPDAPAPSGPPAPAPPPDAIAGLEGEDGAPVEAGSDPGTAWGPLGEATIVQGDLVPPGAGAEPAPPPGAAGTAGRRDGETAGPRTPGSGTAGGARRPADLEPRTEYKFQFRNPGWLKGGGYGTMSFDTQGFPWGDYARQLYVAIRNNWLERIPLAAREGISGHTCQRFVIAREGAITSLDVVRPSEVPPFTKAASDAIRASSPLPPLPRDFPHAAEGVTFCFYYNMYPGEVE